MDVAFEQMFSLQAAPDPQEVADVIKQLIETAPGQRPLRTVIGSDFGVKSLNLSVDAIQSEVLKSLDLKNLATVQPAKSTAAVNG